MSFFKQFKTQESPVADINHELNQSASFTMPSKEYPDIFKTAVAELPRDDSIMPYFWSSDDTKRALYFSIVPVGAVLVGSAALCQDHKYRLFLDTTRAPSWAPKDRWVYSAFDIATALPLGYASYLVYKHGGGFDYTDTSFALGFYGVNLALALGSIPLLKNRNLKGLACNSALVALTAGITAGLFYKIDQSAAAWYLPYALWTGFYALLGYSANQLNKEPKLD